MARQGRAGAALSIAAIGSFFAGCVSTVLVAALGVPLTSIALLFGPAEYFSLMVLGLIFAVVLAKGSVLKAIAMILTGLLLSMVGSDLETGAGRMTFDIAELSDGIGFTNVEKGLWNAYWATIGTYLAHGTGIVGKLLLPLGNTFFAGK